MDFKVVLVYEVIDVDVPSLMKDSLRLSFWLLNWVTLFLFYNGVEIYWPEFTKADQRNTKVGKSKKMDKTVLMQKKKSEFRNANIGTFRTEIKVHEFSFYKHIQLNLGRPSKKNPRLRLGALFFWIILRKITFSRIMKYWILQWVWFQ